MRYNYVYIYTNFDLTACYVYSQMGGFTLPFFSVGALVLLFVVPCNLLVEGKSEYSTGPLLQQYLCPICYAGVSKGRPSISKRVILTTFSNLEFILLG